MSTLSQVWYCEQLVSMFNSNFLYVEAKFSPTKLSGIRHLPEVAYMKSFHDKAWTVAI